MSGTPSRISYFLLLFVLAFWGCEEPVEELPDAPSGTLVIGSELQEAGTAIHAIPSGGFVAAASKQNENNQWSVSLMELNADGELMREEALPREDYDDAVRSIKPASGGGFLMAGVGEDIDGNFNGFILLTDANLVKDRMFRFPVELSSSYYGSAEASYAEAFEMPGGGWTLYVRQRATALALRVSDQGVVSAQRILGASGTRNHVSSREIAQDASGSLYHLDVSYNYPNLNVQVSLLDPTSLFANQTYFLQFDTLSTDVYYDQISAGAIMARPNGNLVASMVLNGQSNFVFEMNNTGTVLWARQLNIAENLFMMQLDGNGSVRLGGQTSTGNVYYGSPIPDRNVILVELDSVGGNLRRRVFGGDNPESIGDIAIGQDGRTQAIGSTSSYGNGKSDIFLFSYN